jgi:hypothetical protein
MNDKETVIIPHMSELVSVVVTFYLYSKYAAITLLDP